MSRSRSVPTLRVVTAAAVAGLVAGCSSDVTRFDFPVYGLTDEPAVAPDAAPLPAAPVAGYAPNEETPRYRSSREARDWTTGLARGNGDFTQNRTVEEYKPARTTRRTAPSTTTRPLANEGYGNVRVQPAPAPTYRAPQTRQVGVQATRNGWVDTNQPVRVEPIAPPAGGRSDRFGTRAQPGGYDVDPYNSPAPTLRSTYNPPVTRAPAGAPAQPTTNTASGEYRVVPGDTLFGIARKTGARVGAIKAANGIAGDTIRVGQVLQIPGAGDSFAVNERQAPVRTARRTVDNPFIEAPRQTDEQGSRDDGFGGAQEFYTVQPGDSLYKIARAQRTSVPALMQVNDIADPSKIRVGQKLRLPGAGAGAVTTARRPRVTPRLDGAALRDGGVDTAPAQPAGRRTASLPRETTTIDDGANVLNGGDNERTALFRWPIKGRLIGTYGKGSDGKFNDGIDIAVPRGAKVRAARAGTVAYAGSELEGYGKLILVRHDKDWVSAYAHNSEILVQRGDRVERGQVISKAGNSGGVAQPMVHFELRKGSKPVDPMKYLAR
ncbi:MAG: LysM peptidoglycan-binding domain-containing protein [Pseudomonadota bacterium]